MTIYRGSVAQQQSGLAEVVGAEVLAPPPGLGTSRTSAPSASISPPPGLMQATAKPACQVRISGLPDKLLTTPTIEVVFEEAGLWGVVGFTLKRGKVCGEAIVGFSSRVAAEHCVAHFSGCRWDPRGTIVSAKLFEDKSVESGHSKCSQAAEKMLPAPQAARSVSAEPAFISTSSLLVSFLLTSSKGTPTMFPAGRPALVAPMRKDIVPLEREKAELGSDASTDAGESEPEEERCLA